MNLPQFSLPAFGGVNMSFFINLPVLVIFLVLFVIYYGVVSSVLVYHWSVYGMKNQGILVGETLFFIVTAFLFVCAGVSLIYF